jgi:hypothetical protein
MKLDEFRAWFEGFTEDMDRAPTAKQWKRIKERVAEIDGAPVTERIYLDRYWPVVQPLYPSRPSWYPYWAYGTGTCSSSVSGQLQPQDATNAQVFGSGNGNSAHGVALSNHPGVPAFDSHSALYAAGKAEALAA